MKIHSFFTILYPSVFAEQPIFVSTKYEYLMNRVEELNILWDRSCSGDQKSYAILHRTLYPVLFNYACKILKDEDLSDDLLQDLFVRFWERKTKIGPLQNVKAYFIKSTRSIVLNHIKSAKLKQDKLDVLPEPDFQFSGEELIIFEEKELALKQLIYKAINTLPSKQKEIIYMRFYEDMEYNQIAEITGIRYQSVINHVYRAIQVLRTLNLGSSVFAA
ncbi:RNA polymerase sigma factor [Pedobacter rhodius]|uniref:RNA polymerase sigma factor n=1 Tax=Pedobacter rhodius TaxID=3004098 RepID=UPI0022B0D10D|nr:sigma-70 family RNA polymerase sigma factor [Pedobacter sp. SJ11]